MSKIKKTGILFVSLWLFSCQTVHVPESYRFTAGELKWNAFGSWMNVYTAYGAGTTTGDTIRGELLYFDTDTLYLLTSDFTVTGICIQKVLKAELLTHKNPSAGYAILTGLLFIPSLVGFLSFGSDINSNFLGIGAPGVLTGLIQILGENVFAGENILIFPGNRNLREFVKFARFPTGKPENLDAGELTLKKR